MLECRAMLGNESARDRSKSITYSMGMDRSGKGHQVVQDHCLS